MAFYGSMGVLSHSKKSLSNDDYSPLLFLIPPSLQLVWEVYSNVNCLPSSSFSFSHWDFLLLVILRRDVSWIPWEYSDRSQSHLTPTLSISHTLSSSLTDERQKRSCYRHSLLHWDEGILRGFTLIGQRGRKEANRTEKRREINWDANLSLFRSIGA